MAAKPIINLKDPNFHGAVTVLRESSTSLLSFTNPSPSKSQLLLVGMVGVSAAVAGLILPRVDVKLGRWLNSLALAWSEQNHGVGAGLFVAGLQNLGNNCFLNSILQALASCCHFRSFLEDVVDAYNLLAEERLEDFPLAVSLIAIVRELSLLRDNRIVATPRGLMLALGTYVSSFDLTSQQDAAEALLHLLSSLKEELSQNYVPSHCSLADISVLSDGFGSNLKIVKDGKEWEQWQKNLFGPFWGTIGSTLTCKTCAVEVEQVQLGHVLVHLFMNYELFYSLPLSPVLNHRGLIIDGCTLEDCLEKFTETEQIDNYVCNRCWHNAGIRCLLISGEENAAELEKLRNCPNVDSCDCKKLLLNEGIAWPTIYSCALKKLHLGRSPDILCFHLQRSSVSELGDLVKLKGHISFPFILNMLPFISSIGNDGKDFVKKTREVKLPLTQTWAVSNFSYCDKQLTKPHHLFGLVGSDVALEKESSILRNVKPTETEGFDGVLDSLSTEKGVNKHRQPQKTCIYRLVSVVEHYGRAGSGHYAVYRNVKIDPQAEDPDSAHCWYYVSDHEVSVVTEDVVRAAEASLLFYERIEGRAG